MAAFIGPAKYFSDAFTEWIEDSREEAVSRINKDAYTSTADLNDIPITIDLRPLHPSSRVNEPNNQSLFIPSTKSDSLAKIAKFNFSTRLVDKSIEPNDEKISGDDSFKSTTKPVLNPQQSKSNALSPSHERSFKSSYSGSTLEPTPDSSVWTRHSESSLFALPHFGILRKNKTLKNLSLLPDGLQNPTVPRICCNIFPVRDLERAEDVCSFIAKILVVKVVQLGILTVCLASIQSSAASRKVFLDGRLYFLIIFGFMFVVVSVGTQCFAHKGPLGLLTTIPILILKTGAATLTLGASTVYFHSPILVMTTTNLAMSSAILVTSYWKKNLETKEAKSLMFILPGVVTFAITMTFFIVRRVHDISVTSEELVRLWLPLFAFSAVILQVFMFELNTVIHGRRFPVSAQDWMYTAAYL